MCVTLQTGLWTRSDIVHKRNAKGKYDVFLAASEDILGHDKLFEVSASAKRGN